MWKIFALAVSIYIFRDGILLDVPFYVLYLGRLHCHGEVLNLLRMCNKDIKPERQEHSCVGWPLHGGLGR
jgi:hypothetical protein